MALKSTIYKADLSIADMDRSYYADHALTLAQHPSETEERMMVRLLAFILNAHERLIFGKWIIQAKFASGLRLVCRTSAAYAKPAGAPMRSRCICTAHWRINGGATTNRR